MSSAVPVPPAAGSVPVHSQTSGGPGSLAGGPVAAGGHTLGDLAAAPRVAALVGVHVAADDEVDLVPVEDALPHRADPAVGTVRGVGAEHAVVEAEHDEVDPRAWGPSGGQPLGQPGRLLAL